MKVKKMKKGIKKSNKSVTKRKKSESKVSKNEFFEEDFEDNDSNEDNDWQNEKTGVYILFYICISYYIYDSKLRF